ncbi:hypothetical protein [Elongatibacter sediminis]|uniref:Uncharacterized protein n=1 Tax=Elongatibacter sediminis TaxID=3119006 RepID=A0AAW9RLY1_9GAMM
MNRPLWFRFIDRWVPEGMGTTGITLPFLAGALAHTDGYDTVSEKQLHDYIDAIVDSPVSGYTVEVRQCQNVGYLVLSVSKTEEALPFQACYLDGPEKAPALGFSQDAQSQFGGLGSSDPDICRADLIELAAPHCASGHFSRLRSESTGAFEFGPFSKKETAYIERIAEQYGEKI